MLSECYKTLLKTNMRSVNASVDVLSALGSSPLVHTLCNLGIAIRIAYHPPCSTSVTSCLKDGSTFDSPDVARQACKTQSDVTTGVVFAIHNYVTSGLRVQSLDTYFYHYSIKTVIVSRAM